MGSGIYLRTTILCVVVAALFMRYTGLVGSKQWLLARENPLLREACQEISAAISPASKVYDAVSSKYAEGISHWATSSTQQSACSFEPGTPEDVGVALRILGQRRIPFAIKGGGHAANPGFSSTEGVHITMSRFSEVVYDPTTQTATIGAGLVWDDVYAALEPYGVNVAGGRVTGVGVAGFILGGGYSWLASQHGLTVDTVQAFELVTPDGIVRHVTEELEPDLFFALKGGMNNYGIVTKFTLKAFPQTQVWGGLIVYTLSAINQVSVATANFAANNTDPRAGVLTMYNYFFGQAGAAVILFYDGPTPPPGTFDAYLAIPSFMRDVSTRSFTSLVKSTPVSVTAGTRAIFNTISVTDYPLPLLDAIVNETMHWGKNLPHSVFFISYVVEPFLPTLLDHAESPSAYPPDRRRVFFPLHMYYAWLWTESDKRVHDAVRTSAKTLQTRAIEDGQPEIADMVYYPNYAIYDTPVNELYGAHLPRLQAIREAVDPENVMRLTGGFKI